MPPLHLASPTAPNGLLIGLNDETHGTRRQTNLLSALAFQALSIRMARDRRRAMFGRMMLRVLLGMLALFGCADSTQPGSESRKPDSGSNDPKPAMDLDGDCPCAEVDCERPGIHCVCPYPGEEPICSGGGCDSDSDCGSGQKCRIDKSIQRRGTWAHCTTTDDECTTDAECPVAFGREQLCGYDTTAVHWICRPLIIAEP